LDTIVHQRSGNYRLVRSHSLWHSTSSKDL